MDGHRPGSVVVYTTDELTKVLALVADGPYADGSYELDGFGVAWPDRMRPLIEGEAIEYYSASVGDWIPATVLGPGRLPRTFDLSCREAADFFRLRLPGGGGDPEASLETVADLPRDAWAADLDDAGEIGPLSLRQGEFCFFRSAVHGWIPAQVLRWRHSKGYDLDVQESVPPLNIHPVREGDFVEYLSGSAGCWIPARVMRRCDDPRTFALDIKQRVDIARLRPWSDSRSSASSSAGGQAALAYATCGEGLTLQQSVPHAGAALWKPTADDAMVGSPARPPMPQHHGAACATRDDCIAMDGLQQAAHLPSPPCSTQARNQFGFQTFEGLRAPMAPSTPQSLSRQIGPAERGQNQLPANEAWMNAHQQFTSGGQLQSSAAPQQQSSPLDVSASQLSVRSSGDAPHLPIPLGAQRLGPTPVDSMGEPETPPYSMQSIPRALTMNDLQASDDATPQVPWLSSSASPIASTPSCSGKHIAQDGHVPWVGNLQPARGMQPSMSPKVSLGARSSPTYYGAQSGFVTAPRRGEITV
mmetsp:Transcript_140804/g.357624  ORF Transcript_140804/g.357624 Transcript_140804/m.357624 type:complete len:530 (+) Transcript_140804:57-1646(+)